MTGTTPLLSVEHLIGMIIIDSDIKALVLIFDNQISITFFFFPALPSFFLCKKNKRQRVAGGERMNFQQCESLFYFTIAEKYDTVSF